MAAAGGRETLSLPVAATPARRGHAGYSRWVGYLLIAAAVLVGGLAVLVWRGPADAPGAGRSAANDRPGPPVAPPATPTDGGGVAPDQPGPTSRAPTGPVAAVQVEVSLQPDGPLVLEPTGGGARLRAEPLGNRGHLLKTRQSQVQYTFRAPENRKALAEGEAFLEFAGSPATATWRATQPMALPLTVGEEYTVSFGDATGSTELFTVTATATEPAGERSAAGGASRQERTLPDSVSDQGGVSDRSAGRGDRHRPQL